MKSFVYRQKLSPALIGLAICAPLSLAVTLQAFTNDAPLRVDRFIDLPVPAATAFWSVAALGCGLLALCCVVLAYAALTSRRAIVLHRNRFEMPTGGFSFRPLVVPYESLRKVEIQARGELRFLHVDHRQGQFTIVPAMLARKSDLDEICRRLQAQMRNTGR